MSARASVHHVSTTCKNIAVNRKNLRRPRTPNFRFHVKLVSPRGHKPGEKKETGNQRPCASFSGPAANAGHNIAGRLPHEAIPTNTCMLENYLECHRCFERNRREHLETFAAFYFSGAEPVRCATCIQLRRAPKGILVKAHHFVIIIVHLKMRKYPLRVKQLYPNRWTALEYTLHE